MAGILVRYVTWSALLLLLGVWPATGSAQVPAAEVSGTVRGVDGAAISGAKVRARAGGATWETVSGADGRYRLSLPRPAAGETYEVKVERIGYFPFATTLFVEPASTAVTRDFRLNPRAVTLDPVEVRAARPAQRPPPARTPGGNEETWQPYLMEQYPVRMGDLGSVAAYAPGAIPLGGEEEGGLPRVSISGRHPSQNNLVVDGASFGATTLPPEAVRSTSIISNTYDPARGRFTGGQIAATTRSGTNLTGGAVRARLDHPALQSSTGGTAAGSQYTTMELGGGAGGAIRRDRFFWYGAFQASRRAEPSRSLATTSPGTLAGLGISQDSVRRFRALTAGFGFGSAWEDRSPEAAVDRALGMLRLDYHVTADHTLTLRLDGRRTRLTGLGTSLYGVSTPGDEVRSASAGALAQIASYVGGARNELRVYRSDGERRVHADGTMPTGLVQVRSALADGPEGFAMLRFGQGTGSPAASRSTMTEISDELLLGRGEDAHRVKVGFVLTRERVRDEGAQNGLGTFTFGSLDDLAAGRPLSFSRTLGVQERAATADYGAVFASHFWHVSRGLWLIHGLRADANAYPGAPRLAPDLQAPAGSQGRIEGNFAISPRIGFTYESADKNWEFHGGTGRFVGTLPVGAIASAFGETGRPSTALQLLCVGDRAPVPEWSAYASGGSIPSACVGGAGGILGGAREVTVFEPGFQTPRTWHSSVGGNGDFYRGRRGQMGFQFDASLIRGAGEPIAVDRNLVGTPYFTLADENRPVYAPGDAIDPATGTVDPARSRIDPTIGTLRAASSRGRSTVAQLTVGTTMLTRRLDVIALYYTFSHGRDEVSGVAAPGAFSVPVTAGDPNRTRRGPSDFERRHTWQLHTLHPIGRWIEVGVIGRLTSGEPFTPLVDADVNGDGQANDAAFLFGSRGDTGLQADLADLTRRASPGIRDCLRRQTGRVAARNSCTGPWSAALDLQLTFPTAWGSKLNRYTVNVTATNVLGGLDRLFNGDAGLAGWGGAGYVDPVLLTVAGFDPVRRSYRYQVNPSFGAQSGRRDPFRAPATLSISGRVTLGSDPARQPFLAMVSTVRAQGRSTSELRGAIAARVPNIPAQVLGVADSLALNLTDAQKASLQARADMLGGLLAPLVDSLAAAVSLSETHADDDRRREARSAAQRLITELQTLFDQGTEQTRAVLTPAQWALLPAAVRQPGLQIIPERRVRVGGGELW